uniref:Tyrosyl-DNA phosphodiesterase n=1 Tax=Ditylenchus dipsaci TaxID=166011 RepID=A0A915CUV0_9BILA
MKRSLDASTLESESKIARFTEPSGCIHGADQASTSSDRIPSSKKPILNDGVYFVAINGLKDDPQPERTISLFELINKIDPIASIHFNYCIDPGFVLSQYPRRCRSAPITLIVGENSRKLVSQACSSFTNVTVGGASIPFTYCTHHSKLSIFESEDAIHVMISTANLIEEDYGLKTQAFYYCRAIFFTGDESARPSKFQGDLLEYLERAYSKSSPSHDLVSYWISRIKQADFGHIKDRIVASVPGRYTSGLINHFGHMKLRKLLSEKFTAGELDSLKSHIGQFSSIGSLGSLPQAWLCDEFLSSLSGKKGLINPKFLKLVYPTVENVRNSLEGWSAGNSLPYSSQTNTKQPYLKNFLHEWKSENLKRTRAMPHVKSYTSLDSNNEPQWMLLTSANLSHSAWGKLEKCRTQLFCRSYELGVLLCLKDHPELTANGLTLPFDVPLSKYGTDDQPFLVDVPYAKPDSMGRMRR